MIIRVLYPNTSKSCKEYFKVNESNFKLGDIVVIDNEQNEMRYGVVVKVDVKTNKQTSNKDIKVASQLDRIYFWLDFESKILHNKVKVSDMALLQYRQTGNNSRLSEDEIINKLTRNMMLIHHPYRLTVGKSGAILFNYGALRLVYQNGRICYIVNRCEIPRGWRKDWDKHWYYSKILDVEMD